MRQLTLTLVVLCLGQASGARAATVTSYTLGQITQDYYGPSGPTPPPGVFKFTPGSTVQLTFTYDTDRIEARPLEGHYGITFGSSYEIVTSDGFRFAYPTAGVSPSPAQMIVRDGGAGGTGDSISILMGPLDASLILTFSDPSGAALSSTGLPTGADFLRFPTAQVKFSREISLSTFGFDADLVPVAAPSAVPEPSSVAMMATGLLALLGVAWRRRRAGA